MMAEPAVYQTWMDSPVGVLHLTGTEVALRSITFNGALESPARRHGPRCSSMVLTEAERQLATYFDGVRRTFDLPLDPQGTAFQRAVWEKLRLIPYGTTTTYRDLAAQIGRPAAVRAVGAANGRNPLPIVIPCHRVLGSDGSLTGYGGGLAIKQALLQLEGCRLF